MNKDEAPASPKDAALRLALEGFENIRHHFDTDEYAYEVAIKSITAIKQALEETQGVSTEPEPVAWMRHDGSRVTTAADRKNYPDYETRYPIPLYTSPQLAEGEAPKRKPLTDEQIKGIYEDCDAPTGGEFTLAFVRAIEAAHGIFANAHNKGEA